MCAAAASGTSRGALRGSSAPCARAEGNSATRGARGRARTGCLAEASSTPRSSPETAAPRNREATAGATKSRASRGDDEETSRAGDVFAERSPAARRVRERRENERASGLGRRGAPRVYQARPFAVRPRIPRASMRVEASGTMDRATKRVVSAGARARVGVGARRARRSATAPGDAVLPRERRGRVSTVRHEQDNDGGVPTRDRLLRETQKRGTRRSERSGVRGSPLRPVQEESSTRGAFVFRACFRDDAHDVNG